MKTLEEIKQAGLVEATAHLVNALNTQDNKEEAIKHMSRFEGVDALLTKLGFDSIFSEAMSEAQKIVGGTK